MTLSSLTRYKDIVLYRTQAGIKSEARQNYLGYIWFLLEPMLSTAVLYFAMSHISGKSGPERILLILIGMVTWGGIEPSIMMGANAIKAKFHVLNQFDLPKWIFPIVTILVNSWKFLCVFSVIIVLSFFLGHPPTLALLWLPVILAIQLTLVIGVTLPLSIAVTLMNDLNTVFSSAFRLLFFVSGIFFTVESIPTELHDTFHWNPIAVIIESFRAVLLHGQSPELPLLGRAAAIAAVFLLAGLAIHKRYDKRLLKLTNA